LIHTGNSCTYPESIDEKADEVQDKTKGPIHIFCNETGQEDGKGDQEKSPWECGAKPVFRRP
jgi:hypothetical protein